MKIHPGKNFKINKKKNNLTWFWIFCHNGNFAYGLVNLEKLKIDKRLTWLAFKFLPKFENLPMVIIFAKISKIDKKSM